MLEVLFWGRSDRSGSPRTSPTLFFPPPSLPLGNTENVHLPLSVRSTDCHPELLRGFVYPRNVAGNSGVNPRSVPFRATVAPADDPREDMLPAKLARHGAAAVASAGVHSALEDPGADHRVEDRLLAAPVHVGAAAGFQVQNWDARCSEHVGEAVQVFAVLGPPTSDGAPGAWWGSFVHFREANWTDEGVERYSGVFAREADQSDVVTVRTNWNKSFISQGLGRNDYETWRDSRKNKNISRDSRNYKF